MPVAGTKGNNRGVGRGAKKCIVAAILDDPTSKPNVNTVNDHA